MSNRRSIARALFLGVATLSMFANPQRAHAHPMGNFSISHYAGIRVEQRFIEVRYLIDMAEIPTYQEIQVADIAARQDNPRLAAYLAQKSAVLAEGLSVEVNARPIRLQVISREAIFPPGAGGLPTMKLGFVYRAPIETLSRNSRYAVQYRDNNFAGRAGWKEVVVTPGAGVSLTTSSASTLDRSDHLSNYPTDLINSPPQDLEASFSVSGSLGASISTKTGKLIVGSPPRHSRISSHLETKSAEEMDAATFSLRANEQTTPRSKFTELVSERDFGFWFLVTAALIAVGLGALHALEPGHGKTIVTAYLVGTRGTPREAILLGLIVTAAHTAGVYLLGAITLYASRYIVPEHLYPWLGMISGLTIAGLASYLLLRAWTGAGVDHTHEVGASDGHWFSSLGTRRMVVPVLSENRRIFGVPLRQTPGAVSLRQLLILGITGGIVPCPAALVVLLGAFSLHRIGFGLFLIVAFSLGLATVLIVIGLLTVYAKQFMARWRSDGPVIKRWLPIASSGFMLVLGLGIAGRAFLGTGIGAGVVAHEWSNSFLGIVLLGLFLGVRHSTDPDHVIAVSTLVSRERSVRQGALIGVLWGVGHTLTIFLVGSAIILLGLVIPPRVGLLMELSVAVMLIVLGILNLTGVLRRLNAKFTAPPRSRTAEPTTSSAAENDTEGSLNRLMGRYGCYQIVRPVVIGLVHGLAGSAAVALLVLAVIPSPLWAIGYLLVFGIGTIIGMMLMTTAIAIPVAYTGKRFAVAGAYLSQIVGLASAGFGVFLVYQIGFVDGLFKAHVHWTPQ